MDPITSESHLAARVASTVERAKKNLIADDNLHPVVLLYGCHFSLETYVRELPAFLLRPFIKKMLIERSDIELVIYVSLANAVTAEEFERLPMRPHQHPSRKLVIRAEGAHVDFGLVAMHVEWQRQAAGKYTFGKILRCEFGDASDVVLTNLWPKRKLNS